MLTLIKAKWKLVVGIGIVLVGLGGWFYQGNKEVPTVAVTTSPVEKGNIKVTVTASGSVQNLSSRELSASSGGAITKINFQNGQQVKEGDLLFAIDETAVLAEIAGSQLDIKQAELELNSTINQRKQLQVYAPISGRITTLPVSTGQDVPKNSVLMTIQDTGKFTYKAPFNGAQVGKILVGQKVDVTITSMFSVLPGKVINVDRLGTASVEGALIHEVTVELANPGSLSPGILAQADIHTSKGIEQSLSTGPLEPSENITVRAGAAGTISQLLVTDNSSVSKGQKLAVLASDSLDNSIQSQQLRLQQLRLKLASLQSKLADYRIVAPISGVVKLEEIQGQSNSGSGGSSSSTSTSSNTTNGGQNYWQVGDEVKAGQALASIVGSSGMIITVPVDEVDIAKIKVGQKSNITVDAFPGQKFKGTVNEVAGQGTVKSNVASFDVTLTVDEVGELKSGMTANVEILVNEKNGVLLLPIEAVRENKGTKFVIMAEGSTTKNNNQAGGRPAGTGRRPGANNGNQAGGSPAGNNNQQVGDSSQRANMRIVETGIYNESVIEISSGLDEGDKVVLPTVTRSTTGNSNNRPQGAGGMGGFGGGGAVRIR